MKKTVFSGVQPTSNITIGNYLGAIKNWVSIQDKYNNLFCVVDLHSITLPQAPAELNKNTLSVIAAYLACGIDIKRSNIFIQSHVHAHSELGWILGCMTPMGWLSRMTQFKDKAGKHKENAGLGLFAYPSLMAADILLYNTDIVPVGEDQKQHLEMTRDLAQSFNSKYNTDYFTIPEPLIMGDGSRIMSLKTAANKMSKSDPSKFSAIFLTDSADDIALKIRKATTDSFALPDNVKDLENRFEAKNLLTIFASFNNTSIKDTVTLFANREFSYLKQQLTELLITKLQPISSAIKKYLDDKIYLHKVVTDGAEKANEIANLNIKEIKKIIGFYS